MAIFRTLGQESESTDIRQFAGFQELPEQLRPLILEVYQSTYLANQSKGLKIAQGIAMATAKSVCETYLIERRCSTCGRQMKEVRVSGGKHQFCPVCHPKAMGYGEMKRMKEGEEEHDPTELPNVKPSTDSEKDAETKDQLGGGFERDKQRENVLSKRSEEDQPKGQWGSSPATPPDTSSDPLIGGALAIMKKNHTGKGMHDAMSEDNAASLQGQNVVKSQSQEEMPNKQPQFDRLTGFMASEEEIRPMTEAEYQLYEDSVTGALKTAKKQGYQLNGEPKQSNIGMSFKMSHPHGHSLNVHMTPDHGMGWSHTHKNGTRKSGNDPYSLGNHLQSMEEKYLGFKKLEGKLSHEKGVNDPAGLAAAIGRKKYGSKGFNIHKHMDEAEETDSHGNRKTVIDKNHASYKAGHRYGKTLGSGVNAKDKDEFGFNPWKQKVHFASTKHLRNTHADATLQAKLDAQRQFRAGAHAAIKKHTGVDLSEENSKQIQTKNFMEKCDFCGKLHGVGPCPMLNSPAMQEDDSLDIQKSNLKKKCKDCGLVHDADTSCEEAATKSDKDTKSSEADAANNTDNEASKVDESEWEVNSPAYPGSNPTAPPAYECGGDWGDAKSILNKNHKDKGDPVEESVIQEMDKHALCFCGHEYGSHNSNGCKSCHKEGHVNPKMASHKFRLNSNVHMESEDPTLQAAVEWIANRVNVKGITESAMPNPAIHQRDKWSNSFLVEATKEELGENFCRYCGKNPCRCKSENPLHSILAQHGYKKGKKLKGHGGFEGHNFTHPETKRVMEVSHSPSLHYWADVTANHASSGAQRPEDHVEAMKKHLASVGKK